MVFGKIISTSMEDREGADLARGWGIGPRVIQMCSENPFFKNLFEKISLIKLRAIFKKDKQFWAKSRNV